MDAVKPLLDIERDFYVYRHNNISINKIKNSIDIEEKKYIDEFFVNDTYIGF